MNILVGMQKLIRNLMKTKEELQEYWKNPDADNNPMGYLDNGTTMLRSECLHEIVSKHFDINAKILELGSNVGRNLDYLFEKGYTNLTGVEINKTATMIMSIAYPECYQSIKVVSGSIEDNIKSFKDNEFDLVFVMVVLEHIPQESEWIFNEMVRISKNILTIEDEKTVSWRHLPRNYKKVFSQLKQTEHERLGHKEGFYRGFRMRLFNG